MASRIVEVESAGWLIQRSRWFSLVGATTVAVPALLLVSFGFFGYDPGHHRLFGATPPTRQHREDARRPRHPTAPGRAHLKAEMA